MVAVAKYTLFLVAGLSALVDASAKRDSQHWTYDIHVTLWNTEECGVSKKDKLDKKALFVHPSQCTFHTP